MDSKRIFAIGVSNGAMMVNRLGCEAADLFAGIGSVIGTLPGRLAPDCRPWRPITVVGVQGVADPIVPFAGGKVGGTLEGKAAGGDVLGGRATQELWAANNGCSGALRVRALPVKVRDGTTVTRREYSGCREGSVVVWYEINGGGHRWPPRQSSRPATERLVRRTSGISSQNIDAGPVIWSHFAARGR